MIVAAEYVRTHYVKKSASDDPSITEILRAVHGEIESIIKQPVEARATAWYFEGRGRHRISVPYTLNVSLTSVQYQPSAGEAWEAVDDVTLTADGYLEAAEPLTKGARYRANLTVGLPSVVAPALLSTSFTANHEYGALLQVLCEMTAVRLGETTHSPFGENRLGLQQIATGGVGTTQTTTLRNLMPSWVEKLRPYRTRMTY